MKQFYALRRQALRIAAVALVYALLQRITPMAMAPFGEASAISLAAGWAFAIASLMGMQAVLPLMLGAWLAYGLQSSAFGLPQVLAVGAQALVIAWLARKACDEDDDASDLKKRPSRLPGESAEALGASLALLTRAAAWRRLLAPALLASAVSAGVLGFASGLLALTGSAWSDLTGITAPGFDTPGWLALAAQAGSDLAGMLIAAPITLTLIGAAGTPWQARRWTVGIPLAAATVLLLVAFSAIARWDLARARTDFDSQAQSFVAQMDRRLTDVLDAMDAARGAMIPVGGQLSRDQFNSMALPWLQKAPAVLALGWHERVPMAELQGFEQRMREAGETGFRIHNREARSGDSLVDNATLAADPFALVLRHGVSMQPVPQRRGNSLGLNVLSVPELRETLLRALAGGPAVASPAFRLSPMQASEPAITVYRSLRGPNGQSAGLVYAAIVAKHLLAPTLDRHPGLRACLLDDEPGTTLRLLAGDPACLAEVQPEGTLQHLESLEFAGRRWSLHIARPLSSAVQAGRHWSAWSFAVPGLVGLVLLGSLLLANAVRIERAAQDREQAVQAAAGSERDLQGIFQTVSTGVVQVAREGRILNANPAFCKLTEYSREELLSMSVSQLTTDGDQVQDEQIRALFDQHRPAVLRVHKHYRTRSGRQVPVMVTVQVMCDEDGRPLYTVGAVQDLSETLQLREAERVRDHAEAANRAKGEFVARMSHELRTPLNAILGFAQLLERDDSSPLAHHQRDWLGRAQKAGWHLLAMINDVLDLARVEQGQLTVSIEQVDVTESVELSLSMVEEAAARRGITLHRALQPDAQLVKADAVRLRQILINLLSNAVKYNREKGLVRISSRRIGDSQIEIQVSDTGSGMDDAQLGALFQPFNRLGREQSGIEGNGIGLVIARRLAELMGGSLRADSEPGVGSCFTLCLAVADSLPVPRQVLLPQQAAGDVSGYGNRRVLYIEDNECNVEIMRGMLSLRPQIDLQVAVTGTQGLSLAAAEPPQLVLLDLGLPDMTGLELLRRMKAESALSRLPVIVVSADATDDHVAAALDAGADDFVTKPVQIGALLNAIDVQLAEA